MAFKHGNHTLIDLDAGNDTKITSATGQDIVFYPDQHIWIKQGTKLIFEGTVPDDFEAKLQATSVTADRDIILPDESGTLATQAYVTSAVSGGSLANTDALAEGSTNLYLNGAGTTDNLTEGSTNLYHTDARALAATDGQEVKFKNLYTNLADLPSATSYHGMFAHVHTEGKGYFAHAGNWIPLANESSVPTDLTDLSISDGSADQVLKTDGSGNFSFAAVSALTGSGIQNIADDSTPELGGDLVTGQNRIAFADTGTVSFLDFTVNQFSETNHTVLSSVKSINFYLDSNGGDAGQAFRIFNNQNPDGTVTETSHIFKVAETGDVSVSNDLSVAGNATITGDLTVSGTTTTINTNELSIGDNIITLNADETGVPSQNAGIAVERGTSPNVELRYNETNDQWEFTNDGTNYVAFGTASSFSGNTDGVPEGSTNLYYTDARADTRATLRINAATTDNISEGTGNLYYTDARVESYLTGGDGISYASGTIDVDSTVLRTTGAQSIAGVKTFTDTPIVSGLEGSGALTIKSGGQYMYLRGSDNGNMFVGRTGQWAAMYYADSIKVKTVSTGAEITGNLTVSNDSQTDSLGVGTAPSSTSGEIRATNDVTAYYSSDANLKTNIVNIDNALEKVKQIRGVEFDWTQEYIDEKGGEDGYFVRKHDVGVIAQEVEAVLPEVVGTRDNGTKAVRYDRMVALLIEAIKDQQSQIDELKQIITDLSNK